MPRNFRMVPESGPVHIMCRGNNRRDIFHQLMDKTRYYRLIKKYQAQNKIDINHYCLMDNHIHLIVWLHPESRMSKFMKQVNLSYTYYYKKQYKYIGHLWQNRFKSAIINTDIYLLRCGKYIELNPVRAGIVSDPGDFGFSSYPVYAHGKSDSIITLNPLYQNWGVNDSQKQADYRNLVLPEEEMHRMMNSGQNFIGGKSFISDMETYYNIKNLDKPRGRPCKRNK